MGLEKAGFQHVSLFEIDGTCCSTLRWNRDTWNVIQADINYIGVSEYKGVDLLAGGLPCPPFSVAGKQLGYADERDLFPAALRLIDEARPRAVMLENVRGLLEARFANYRASILQRLDRLGYKADWQLLDASDFGVSQFRRRAILVAIQKPLAHAFMWPDRLETTPPSVGEKLYDQMASRGWRRVLEWSIQANKLAPTIVGGSAKHGGPDLGPVRARKSWATLGVDGKGIADEPPDPEFAQMPRLTVSMVSRLQGFPDEWEFAGRKTAAYRQVGNAFPPAVAKSIGEQIANALVSFKLVPVP